MVTDGVLKGYAKHWSLYADKAKCSSQILQHVVYPKAIFSMNLCNHCSIYLIQKLKKNQAKVSKDMFLGGRCLKRTKAI